MLEINKKVWFHSNETFILTYGTITDIVDCYYIIDNNPNEKHLTVYSSLDEIVLNFITEHNLDLFEVQSIIEKAIFASVSKRLFNIGLAVKDGFIVDQDFIEISSAVNDLLEHNVSNLKMLKALDKKMIEMGF